MKCYLCYILSCLFLTTLKVAAQENELFYKTVSLQNLEEFKPTTSNWKLANDIYFDQTTTKTKISSGNGILVNMPAKKDTQHLYTNFEHNDIEIELDFMMAKGSNAGIYFQGRYEIQLFDSWGMQNPKYYDCGGIYQRWDESRPEGHRSYEGHAPAQNVSKAPGLWQHFKILFQAPRFNQQGEKIANARFVKVIHNGVIIHRNVELTGPTRSAAFQDEKALGPLMFQGDHGQVAIRNIRYKTYTGEQVQLDQLKLKAYEGKFKMLPDFETLAPHKEMDILTLQHRGTNSDANFAGSITGTIQVPRAGEYFIGLQLNWITDDPHFSENSNGAGEFIIGKKKLLTIDGSKTSEASGVVKLEKGAHPVQINYYKNQGNATNNLTLTVEGPGVKRQILNPSTTLPQSDAIGEIILPVESKPIILQTFVNHQGHKKTHAVAVGELGKINYSYDLSTGVLLQIWRGDFVETTSMWHERGHDQLAIQLGSVIEFADKPSLIYLLDTPEVKPDSNASYNYLGFDLDQAHRPIFKYTVGEVAVRESFEMEDSGRKLSRNFKVVRGQGKDLLWCRVAEGNEITKLPNGMYAVDGKQYLVELPAKVKPVIRTTLQNRKELLLPFKGKNSEIIEYAIIW